MLPAAYRIIKGFATFFGVLGVLSCIGGIIGGIIANPALRENKSTSSSSTSTSGGGVGVPGAVSPAATVVSGSTLTTIFWK